MMKRIFALALALAMVLCFGAVVFAADLPMMADETLVISSEEGQYLEDSLQALSAEVGFDVVLYYASDLHGREAQALADDFYDYNGYGQGENKDGMILMICPSARKYAFSTTGYCYDLINGARFDQLESAVVEELKMGDWFAAGVNYMELVYQFAQEGLPADRQPEKKSLAQLLIMLPGSLITGFIFSLIPSGIQKGKLKSVAQQTQANAYVAENGVNITASEDILVNHFVTRQRIQQSSSSDGGRGTHTSSSGTSHGGRSGSF